MTFIVSTLNLLKLEDVTLRIILHWCSKLAKEANIALALPQRVQQESNFFTNLTRKNSLSSIKVADYIFDTAKTTLEKKNL